MTQFFTDFSEYTIDESPSDWTPWAGRPISDIIVRLAASGDKFLRKEGDGEPSARHAFTWDAVPLSADVEVYSEWEVTNNLGRGMQHAVRVDPDKNQTNSDFHLYLPGYVGQRNQIGVEYYFDGDYNNDNAIALNPEPSHNTRYSQLTRVRGDQIKVKVWLSTDPEPSEWGYETTLTLINKAGFTGLGGWLALNVDYYAFGVGTGSYDAPRSAAQLPAITSTNPLQGGEVFQFSGSNYSAQPTGPMTFTQGTRTISRAVTISNWNAGDGSFTGVTDTALPGMPAAGASDTPALLYGEPVTISLPDPGA